jgi:arylsulfatase A-like enzyme
MKSDLIKNAMLIVGMLLGRNAVAVEKESLPNFVFILADDLGWGDLGCYGHPRIKTPNIDRLASEGIRFTQFYVNSPVCSPTRAGIMTGQFPSRHGLHTQIFGSAERMEQMKIPRWLNPDAVQLPRVLKEAGYQTAHIGKWHLSVPQNKASEIPVPERYGIDFSRLPDFNWKKLGLEWDPQRTSELFVDQALQFIDQRDQNKPFFMQVWLDDPHNPYHPTDEQLNAYPGMPPEDPLTKYWALVTELDRQVGRIIEKVERAGLTKKTYIIFTSDNGPADPSDLSANGLAGTGSTGPFRGSKGSLYDGGIRTPFVLRGPGVPANLINEKTVFSGVDLLPTFCSLAGVQLSASYVSDGEDMSEAFAGQPVQRTKSLMWFYPVRYRAATINQSPVLAIRKDQWKLLVNPDGSRVELYDMTVDLTETDNLAVQFPVVVAGLKETVLGWYRQLPPNVLESGAGTLTFTWPGSVWSAASETLR